MIECPYKECKEEYLEEGVEIKCPDLYTDCKIYRKRVKQELFANDSRFDEDERLKNE